MRGSFLAACALILALAGCGGGDDRRADRVRTDEDVVRAWAAAVREGDYAAANALFAVPATIANGTPKVRLRTRADVDEFNRSLPCGAIVVDTQPANGGYTRAIFRLTEGRGCGTGTGDEAEVSFRIEDGKITEWLREAAAPPPGSTEV